MAYQAVRLLSGDIRPGQFMTGPGEDDGFFVSINNGPMVAALTSDRASPNGQDSRAAACARATRLDAHPNLLAQPFVKRQPSFMRDLDRDRKTLPPDIATPAARTAHDEVIHVAVVTDIA